MAERKNFTVGGAVSEPISPTPLGNHTSSCNEVDIKLSTGKVFFYSFKKYEGLHFDQILYCCVEATQKMADEGIKEPDGLKTVVNSGLERFFQFLAQKKSAKELRLEHINKGMILEFTSWLRLLNMKNGELISENTARSCYSKAKIVLGRLCEAKLITGGTSIFPKNPFPGATSPYKRRGVVEALSERERESVMLPLKNEIAKVMSGTHWLSEKTQIGLCAFGVFLKLGLNATSLLEIPRDLSKCFVEHPSRNKRILLTQKRRARKNQSVPVLKSAEDELGQAAVTVPFDVYRICEKVLSITAPLVYKANSKENSEKLWIYEHLDGEVYGLSAEDLSGIANAFTARHQLVRDDGGKLKMSTQLFRNSKINAVWRKTGGDLLATSISAANMPKVTEAYLQVSLEQIESHRFAGEVMTSFLSTPGVSYEQTPVAGCNDIHNGERAPKNGSTCTDFLSCFRCSAQVILRNELHKLFSFYWALLSQFGNVSRKIWKNNYAWVIRVIDRDISSRFDPETIRKEKERARANPHPMWRDHQIRSSIISVTNV